LRVHDLARVALHAEATIGKKNLVQLLQQILPDAERKPSRLLRTLARLPLRVIVMTTYDRLMERAFGPSRHTRRPRPRAAVRARRLRTAQLCSEQSVQLPIREQQKRPPVNRASGTTLRSAPAREFLVDRC
jgi:hypothetical protein